MFVRNRGRVSRANRARVKANLRESSRIWRPIVAAAAIPYDANRVVGTAVVCWARIVASEPLMELDAEHDMLVHEAENPLQPVTLNPLDAAIAAKGATSCIHQSSDSLPTLRIPESSTTAKTNGCRAS